MSVWKTNDLFKEICSYLSLKDILNLSCSSRELRNQVFEKKSGPIWKAIMNKRLPSNKTIIVSKKYLIEELNGKYKTRPTVNRPIPLLFKVKRKGKEIAPQIRCCYLIMSLILPIVTLATGFGYEDSDCDFSNTNVLPSMWLIIQGIVSLCFCIASTIADTRKNVVKCSYLLYAMFTIAWFCVGVYVLNEMFSKCDEGPDILMVMMIVNLVVSSVLLLVCCCVFNTVVCVVFSSKRETGIV
jgi:uncharacterized membrane protein YozB (DUF420 family)